MEAAAARRKSCEARYSGERMEEITRHAAALVESLQSIAQQTQALTAALEVDRELSIKDQWVETWGETVNKKTAAAMLGVSPGQITKLVTAGVLPVTPDGRVLVRQACEWANSGAAQPERKRAAARRNTIPFRP